MFEGSPQVVSPSLQRDTIQWQNLGLIAQEASSELDDAVGDGVEVSSLLGAEVLQEVLETLDEAIPLLACVVVRLA